MEKCSNSWNFKDKQDTEDQQKDSEVMCLLQYIFWDWWDRTGAVHASTDYRQGIGYIHALVTATASWNNYRPCMLTPTNSE